MSDHNKWSADLAGRVPPCRPAAALHPLLPSAAEGFGRLPTTRPEPGGAASAVPPAPPHRSSTVALDRQSIEKKDFPIARRGYDPEAVDAHLERLAAEVE